MYCENIIIAGCLSFGIIVILVWVWLKMPIKKNKASDVTEKNFFIHGFVYSVKTKDGLKGIPQTNTWIGMTAYVEDEETIYEVVENHGIVHWKPAKYEI